MSEPRIICFVPSDRPVGGIAKVLDYAVHASRAGLKTVFCCRDFVDKDKKSALFAKPYFEAHGASIEICDLAGLVPTTGDLLFFTLPSSHRLLSKRYAAANAKPAAFINLLQNVRVANIAFDGGYSFRLLPKPMHRICITQQVVDAVAPYVEATDDLHLIDHGFDFQAFEQAPHVDEKPILNFNMFKGDFGARVAAHFENDSRVAGIVKSGRGIPWSSLRQNYKDASIFIATPLPEEGLYLPGLEAMAAGNLVITSDAVGNRFYCDYGDNCLLTDFQSMDGHINAINWALDNWSGEAFGMRQRAHEKARDLDLEGEFEKFATFLNSLA